MVKSGRMKTHRLGASDLHVTDLFLDTAEMCPVPPRRETQVEAVNGVYPSPAAQ